MRKVLIFLSIVSYAGPAIAESVHLKNGTVIKGSIVSMTESDIIFNSSDLGTIVIKRRSVAKILDDTARSSEPAAATQPVQAVQPMPQILNNLVQQTPSSGVVNNNSNNNNNQMMASSAVLSPTTSNTGVPLTNQAPESSDS